MPTNIWSNAPLHFPAQNDGDDRDDAGDHQHHAQDDHAATEVSTGKTIATVPQTISSTPYSSSHHQSDLKMLRTRAAAARRRDFTDAFLRRLYSRRSWHDPFDFLISGTGSGAPAPPFNHRLEIEFCRRGGSLTDRSRLGGIARTVPVFTVFREDSAEQ